MKKEKIKKIPFFESKDNNHCFQYCLKMVLAYWLPDKKFSLKELDKITGHVWGKWTWQGQAILHLIDNGFEIVNIENLDYESFSREGESYLRSIWDKETFSVQKKYSNLTKERKVAKLLTQSNKVNLINKEVTIKDITNLIKKGYLVLVSINPYALRKEEGYSSHLVVITKLLKNSVVFHDPGPPGISNKKVSYKIFEKAMTKPAKADGNILAIKPTKT
jgi:hypothetical protein